MDRDQFDALARFVWTKVSRRTAVATVFGAVVLRHAPDLQAAKRKNKRKARRKNKRKRNDRPCYPSINCHIGPGRDNARCDFEGSVAFFEGNFSGSSFYGANLTGAQLAKADLQGVDLGDACLVGANLRDADLAGANLNGATFCHTLMPDGSINDSGCERGTRCCPTGCEGEVCPTQCIDTVFQICSVFGTPCCRPMYCEFALLPFLTTCVLPCNNDEQCIDRLGPGWACQININDCPLTGPCCTRIGEE